MDQFVTLTRKEHFMFTDEDDDKMLRKLIENSDAHGSRVVEVEPLRELISDILKLSSTTDCKGGHADPVRNAMDSLKKKISSNKTFEGLANDIHKISCKISCKCTGEGTGDENTVSALIETLSSYSWDAKVVLVMAAFAVSYGGFFFSLGAVGTDKWKPLQPLEEVIPAMVNLINNFINARKQLPADNPLSQWIVQTTVYWTIRSVVACVPHLFGFLGLGHEYTPSNVEYKELCKLMEKLNATNQQIQVELDRYSEFIEAEIIFKYYQKLKLIFQQTGIDNITILKALIDVKGDHELPLVKISDGNRFGVEVVARRNVLLLVSRELTIHAEEIGTLADLYKNTNIKLVSEYELVCLPMGKTKDVRKDEFKDYVKQKELPWYVVHDDYSINKAVVQYIQDVWHFNKKHILVALNPQGKLISQNAFDNIMILGSSDPIGLPSIIMPPEDCWGKAIWGLRLLFQNIEEGKEVLRWVDIKDQFICLCGGEDINWVMNFRQKVQEVMAGLNVRMVYIGARNQTKTVKENFINIKNQSKNLIHCSQELASQFWDQLDSMEQLRTKFIINKKGSIAEGKDQIIQGIRSLLTYDSSEKGWAMICQESNILLHAKGNVISACFLNWDDWKKESPTKDSKESIKALIQYVDGYDYTTHCNRLTMTLDNGRIPKDIKCPNCPDLMQKFITYRCCND